MRNRRGYRWLRRALGQPGTAVAIVALLLATAGSATAARTARQITGAQIKDGSLTGANVKNATLQAADFNAASRTQMKGRTGMPGGTGPAGARGPTGPEGAVGPKGDPARVTSNWAWFDSHYLRTDGDNTPAPNDWQHHNGSGDNGNIYLPNLQWTNSLNRSYETVLSLNSPNCNVGEVQGVDCPWGANDGGAINVAWDANITAVAEISILHSDDSDDAADGSHPHTRASCYLAANRGSGSSDFDQIGAKASVSGFRDRQVETLTLVGSINRDAKASTDYMVRVECRDADGSNGRNRYFVVAGSMSVVATQRG